MELGILRKNLKIAIKYEKWLMVFLLFEKRFKKKPKKPKKKKEFKLEMKMYLE